MCENDSRIMPRLGLLSTPQSGSGFPPRMQGQTSKELPFYKVGSLSKVGEDGATNDSSNTISIDQAHELKAKIIPSGSILLAKIGAALLLGRFVQTKFDCCIDNNMLALIPQEGVASRYLYYATCLIDVTYLENPGPVPTLDISGLAQVRIPLPPLPTQRAIADYLDRETAEIDGMRADLDEMERLLAERRQSIKSGHFDSPAAQSAVKVKYLATINTGSGDTQDAVQDGPYSFYVRSDKVLSSSQWDFKGPAVLTAGDGAGVGKIFHYAEGEFKVHQRVYCLHNFHNVDPLYFFNAFSYLLPKEVLYGGASSTVPSLRMHMLEDLQIPLPPLAEQRRIADEIDRETAEIDSMLSDITKLRDLLSERRAALISAAVTGQIDIPVSPPHKDEVHA